MKPLNFIKEGLLQERTILIIYLLAAIAVSIHLVWQGNSHVFVPGGQPYTFYNNYIIFKESFFNLISGRDLYILYPEKQWDLYKYSPAFALFMGSMAYLPDVAGLAIWNSLNALVLFFAIRSLPLSNRSRNLILLFIFIEMLGSLQNSQSNGLMAGSIILAGHFLRKGKVQWAALWLVIGTFIKIYAAVGFVLFLFYPGKLRFLLYAALWTVIFAAVPLVVTSPGVLWDQYQSWARMMANDQSTSYGYSVMGWLSTWFGLDGIKTAVTLAGILLFFVPVARLSLYKNDLFRLLFLAHILVWVIIFNHKAESPTFIIAVSGIAIWYFSQAPVRWRTLLLWFVFIGTCLTPTDLFPPDLRKNFFVPYVIKAFPPIVLWLVLIYQIMALKPKSIARQETGV
ncbi:MAG TPA: glycosyltransferase family 87 protein [Flavipsychrobacter sp.]|nr:glycosyltransferase family 87 protein [Flavipsychrobacter sp.]